MAVQNCKTMGKKHKIKLCNICLGNNFLNIIPKTQAAETKIVKWDYPKVKSFSTEKRQLKE
jgi:hypothetical protein